MPFLPFCPFVLLLFCSFVLLSFLHFCPFCTFAFLYPAGSINGSKIVFDNFVKRSFKPLDKILRIPSKVIYFFSELKEVEVRICVRPNFPIINLILLNGFYKFAKSMGPNTIEGYGPSIPSIRSNSIKLLKQIMCLLSNYLAFYVGIYATVKAVLTQCLQAVSAVQAAYIGWYHVNPPVQRVQNVYGKGGRESLKPNYGRPNLPLVSRICSTKCCCPEKPTL